jgi:PKD repeat protein
MHREKIFDASLKVTIQVKNGLNSIPATICSPKTLSFVPVVTSVSGSQSASNLVYHWNLGTGVARDTANTAQADFTYTNPGKYNIALSVESAYGCKQSLTKPIEVFQGLAGYIDGPVAFCQDETISFLGKTQIPGQPKWTRIFPDGSGSGQQNPPAIKFTTAGSLPLKPLVDNGGCADTVLRMLTVHSKPVDILAEKSALLCEGASVGITAANASGYLWTPSSGLSSSTGATVQANPAADIVYVVTATSEFGCSAKDSIPIQVARPITVQLAGEGQVCLGEPLELAATGAKGYQWINETASLSNTGIGNPIARP